jgi:Big-like domain-containing protein
MTQGTFRRVLTVAFVATLSVGGFWLANGQAGAVAPAAPVAVDDEYSTPMNVPLVVPAPGMLGNDTNLPAGSSYKRIFDANHNAANSFSPNGAFSYTPDTDFAGDDSYTYCITASAFTGDCLSNSATITIHVIAPPTAVNDEYSTQADTALTVAAPGVFGNDTALPSSPTYKTLTTFAHSADFDFNADGSIAYTPAAGFTGDDAATYCITKSANDQTCASNTATVTIHVLAAPPGSTPPATSTPPTDGTGSTGSTGSTSSDPTAVQTTDDPLPVETSSSSSGLAATGFPTSAATLTAVLLLFTGGFLVAVGRRSRGRHS